jgi:hypothetical protein
MADEESGADKPPRSGGAENPEAVKKSTAKKKTRKKSPKLAACKPATPAPSTSAVSKAAPTPTVKPGAAASRPAAPAGAGTTPTYGGSSESDNMRSGFLALWGPATMLIFVVLIFRFMGEGDAERALSAQGAAQALLSSGQESAATGSDVDVSQPMAAAGASKSDASSSGTIMDAIRSATPDQITAALEAARSAINQTPSSSESGDGASAAATAADSAAPPPPGGFDNPWAPTSSEELVTTAEPPPPPVGQQPYSASRPSYPSAMPPQGYPQYGWQPIPHQGYGPTAQGRYPPQSYPPMPPQGAYSQQPYWGQQQPYAGQQPYGGQQPYAGQQPYGQQPYPPPPPGY